MNVEMLKEALRKKAVIFRTGGIRPTGELGESWIGGVRWKREEEELPADDGGDPFHPLAMLFLKDLPYVPEALRGVELLSVFASPKVFENLAKEDLSPWFVIRRYGNADALHACRWESNVIRPFPLVPQLVENDFPLWDGGGMPAEIEGEILRQERENALDYYEDVFEDIYGENCVMHKLGGYPSFCQSGHWFGGGYEYVLQIASDEKAQLNIVDCGNFYFSYHPQKKDWKVYCDFC